MDEEKFSAAEKAGRNIVEKIISGHCINYEFTKDRYCPVDLFVTGYTKKAVVEIKNRTGYTSNDVDNMGGHIFEWKKYTGLTSYDGYEPIYTITYPDCTIMWNVSAITPDRFVTEDKYKHYTVVSSGTITKKVAYLKKEEATTIIPNYIYTNEKDSGENSQ